MIRRIAALAALLLALALAACAQPSADSAGSAPSVAPSTGLPSAGLPSAGLPSAEGNQTLSGTVTAGVEPNCLVLSGDGATHLLVFHDESLRSAAKVGTVVTVVGKARPELMSTCQQGTPFIVTSVRPN
jgi:hypothetical protein